MAVSPRQPFSSLLAFLVLIPTFMFPITIEARVHSNTDYQNHYSKPKPIKFHILFYYIPLTFHNHMFTLIASMQISRKWSRCIIFDSDFYAATFRTFYFHFFDTRIIPERKLSSHVLDRFSIENRISQYPIINSLLCPNRRMIYHTVYYLHTSNDGEFIYPSPQIIFL